MSLWAYGTGGVSFFFMSPTIYQFLHVFSVLILAGGTFYAFAAPEASRKRVLMITGIASLVALVAAFGLLSKLYNNTFHFWVIVKLVVWLGLSALSGLAFRRRDKAGFLMVLTAVLLAVSVAMVYFKPGM